nr:subtilisin-like protease SBT1.7 [Ipomoea batatas]
MLPFVYTGNASNATDGNLCIESNLDAEKVKGKIVLCNRRVNATVENGIVVKATGSVGVVLANITLQGEELVANADFVPSGDGFIDYGVVNYPMYEMIIILYRKNEGKLEKWNLKREAMP